MAFKKGDPKPRGSGRTKGTKNKAKLIKIADFVLDNEIDLAKELYQSIQTIQDPVAKTKALMDYYKFIDAPVKEKVAESEDEESDLTESMDESVNILALTNGKN